MRELFDMDNPFWRWIGRIPEIVGLSVCWYVCCLPIITIIPASCALFDATSRTLMMDNEKGVFKRFFRTFIHELKRGIPLTIFWLILGVLVLWGYGIVSENLGVFSIVYVMTVLMLVAYLGWLIPVQSRYSSTFIQLHINALRLFLGRLPSTGLMLLTTIAVVAITLSHPFAYILASAAPCLIAIFHSFPVEKAFEIVSPQDYIDGVPIYTEQEPIFTKKEASTETDDIESK